MCDHTRTPSLFATWVQREEPWERTRVVRLSTERRMRLTGLRSEHIIAPKVDIDDLTVWSIFWLTRTTTTHPLSVVQYRPSTASTKARLAYVELPLRVLAIL
jgi:hypothetical protein